jgi:hypothetical protein
MHNSIVAVVMAAITIAVIKLCIDGLYFFHYVFYNHNRDATPYKKVCIYV